MVAAPTRLKVGRKDMVMNCMSLQDFICDALRGSGVMNDSTDVWVYVCGVEYGVAIDMVLDHDEVKPFEASYTLESDLQHPAWKELYSQYLRLFGMRDRIKSEHELSTVEDVFYSDFVNLETRVTLTGDVLLVTDSYLNLAYSFPGLLTAYIEELQINYKKNEVIITLLDY